MMKYKDYIATVEYDEIDKIFVGQVINTRDLIAFDGKSVQELDNSFHAVIEEYISDCKATKKEPEKPFSGKFVVRLLPEQHREAFFAAKKAGMSLNKWVVDTISKATQELYKQTIEERYTFRRRNIGFSDEQAETILLYAETIKETLSISECTLN